MGNCMNKVYADPNVKAAGKCYLILFVLNIARFVSLPCRASFTFTRMKVNFMQQTVSEFILRLDSFVPYVSERLDSGETSRKLHLYNN